MRSLPLFALLLASLLGGGCHLHLWAGEHQLTIPPQGAAPTPSPAPTPESRY
ncbi:MAG TPA: hypothetical protein VMR29_07735 [Candidatus Binatia bacterium]|nr:hypothetical protein [Candidatus Binatia bacterium]